MSGLHERFPNVSRQLRHERGWSQERLAEGAKLKRFYIGEIERSLASTSLVTGDQLGRALEIDLSALEVLCAHELHSPEVTRDGTCGGCGILSGPSRQEADFFLPQELFAYSLLLPPSSQLQGVLHGR